MISINNLQEQVLKNTKDIADIKELDFFINGLGIKVLGIQPDIESIPEREYEYGDAWLIGSEEPYDLYVWTRADVGEEWVNLGHLFIRGPEGPQGIQGERGLTGRSTKWYAGSILPSTANDGDMFIDTTNRSSSGNIYLYNASTGNWNLQGNIKGTQGIQGEQGIQGIQGEQGPVGPKGDTGDVGGFINIAGILDSASRLQSYPYRPMDLHDLTKAYLVGPNPQAYSLYVQIGSDSATAYWQNMGPLNVATYVSVNGVFQNTWNADTKLNKAQGTQLVYVNDSNGNPTTIWFTEGANALAIARRDAGGHLYTQSPTTDLQCANKKYVDDAIAGGGGGGGKLYKHRIKLSPNGAEWYGDIYTTIYSTRNTPYTDCSFVQEYEYFSLYGFPIIQMVEPYAYKSQYQGEFLSINDRFLEVHCLDGTSITMQIPSVNDSVTEV